MPNTADILEMPYTTMVAKACMEGLNLTPQQMILETDKHNLSGMDASKT